MRVHVVSGMWSVHTPCLTPDSDAFRGLYLAGLAWIAEYHVKDLSPAPAPEYLDIWALVVRAYTFSTCSVQRLGTSHIWYTDHSSLLKPLLEHNV